MLRLCLFLVLGCSALQALCQFNTVRKVSILPTVQVLLPPEQARATDTVSLQVSEQRRVKTLSLPLQKLVQRSAYGQRVDPFTGRWAMHQGIDFSARRDTVLAIMPGRVCKIGYSKGLGNYIEVDHGSYKSIYGHLSLLLVREQMVVGAGAALAITGSTGRSTGEHLHFTLRYKGKPVNPAPYLAEIYRRIAPALSGGR